MHDKESPNGKTLEIIYTWMKSWFNCVETRAEYEVSFLQLTEYYSSNMFNLGSNCVKAIDTVLDRLSCNLNSIVHYNFLNIITLVFWGVALLRFPIIQSSTIHCLLVPVWKWKFLGFSTKKSVLLVRHTSTI